MIHDSTLMGESNLTWNKEIGTRTAKDIPDKRLLAGSSMGRGLRPPTCGLPPAAGLKHSLS